ncbi:hypothetical protein MTR67_027771 [Solanum verrucosum]|uniref:Late blight resistance protein n=1 Tax=Solanum verrucosum TaxID=315347 RepID=A0AAF0TVQ6_SOLVR|nr:hypothetical protein MTR67_027771 [Solanum verrucosum]
MVDQHGQSIDPGWHSRHHPRTVGGPTVHPTGPWFVSANSPRTKPEIRLSVDPRSDLRSVGQVTDRGSCLWIDAPKAQLLTQTTVNQHGPSIDPRSIGEGSSQLAENFDGSTSDGHNFSTKLIRFPMTYDMIDN